MTVAEIDILVQKLPEIYQKIYGHPQHDNSSRFCDDRKDVVLACVQGFQNFKGRKNLDVLDLGCAQGYFSFSLKSAGCNVSGVDFCKENVDLCNALNEENGWNCDFSTQKIDLDFVSAIPNGKYDVILLLSVIHHICHERGFEYAQSLMTELASKAEIVITELAVKAEPLYWNKNLPENYERWFDGVKFYDELAFFKTHLSDIKRPLIVASDKYFVLHNVFRAFNEYRLKAFDIKGDDINRRYYLSDDCLHKLYRAKDSELTKQMKNEIRFLDEHKKMSFVPQLLDCDINERRVLMSQKIQKGRLLFDMVIKNETLDYDKIFSDVLSNCIELEDVGLYHGDLRIWNVCVKDGGAFLIDFGNIQDSKNDPVFAEWNPKQDFDVYDSYISLVYDTLTKNTFDTIAYGHYEISSCFDFALLPEKYANFIKSYLVAKSSKTNFRQIKMLFEKFVLDAHAADFTLDEQLFIQNKMTRRALLSSASNTDKLITRQMIDEAERRLAQLSAENKLSTRQMIDGVERRLAQLSAENQELRGLLNAKPFSRVVGLAKKILRRK